MDDDDEEEFEEDMDEEWLEHWIVVGKVSDKAKEAIELVNGKVEPMYTRFSSCVATAVCFLYAEPEDDDVGFVHGNDGKALKLDVFSADEHITLVLYSIYPNPDRDVSDVTGLHLVAEEEWFKIVDEQREMIS
jgi:hypothetical protein